MPAHVHKVPDATKSQLGVLGTSPRGQHQPLAQPHSPMVGKGGCAPSRRAAGAVPPHMRARTDRASTSAHRPFRCTPQAHCRCATGCCAEHTHDPWRCPRTLKGKNVSISLQARCANALEEEVSLLLSPPRTLLCLAHGGRHAPDEPDGAERDVAPASTQTRVIARHAAAVW